MGKIKVTAFIDIDEVIEVDDNLTSEEIWDEVDFFINERLQRFWKKI